MVTKAAKPEPAMVMLVPPAVEPSCGLTDVTRIDGLDSYLEGEEEEEGELALILMSEPRRQAES